MMATRVSDSELAARLRQRNRVNSERRRIRLAAGGKVQLLAWIPATLRSELDRIAAARGEPLSDTTTALLSLALTATATPAGTVDPPVAYTRPAAPTPAPSPGTVETMLDMFREPATPAPTATTGKAALMSEIAAMLDEGLSGAEIARRLNSSGRRTTSGAEFSGANLLRDYRAWREKKRTVESH